MLRNSDKYDLCESNAELLTTPCLGLRITIALFLEIKNDPVIISIQRPYPSFSRRVESESRDQIEPNTTGQGSHWMLVFGGSMGRPAARREDPARSRSLLDFEDTRGIRREANRAFSHALVAQ